MNVITVQMAKKRIARRQPVYAITADNTKLRVTSIGTKYSYLLDGTKRSNAILRFTNG